VFDEGPEASAFRPDGFSGLFASSFDLFGRPMGIDNALDAVGQSGEPFGPA
jgi:hypothetical protein